MIKSPPLKLSVLILGSPRSGTTWLAKLFDSNEHVLYRHEPDSVVYEEGIPFLPEVESTGSLNSLVGRYLTTLANVRQLKVVGSLPVFSKSYRLAICEKFRFLIVILYKFLDALLRPMGFKGEYNVPDLIKRKSLKSTTVVVKSVNSLGRAKAFSSADKSLKIVHIVRHPCGFVASQLRGGNLNLMKVQTFLDTQAKMTQAKRRGLSLDVLERLSIEEQLASLWMMQNEKVMEEMSGNPQYKLVRYEDLCAEPHEVLGELFVHADISMTDQVSGFLQRSQTGDGKKEKYFQVVRDTKKASTKWLEELDSNQVNRIMDFVGDSLPGKLYL